MAGATPWAWDGQDVTLPANAVACNPGTSIQSVFNANPGKDVWLASGTHGPQSVTIPAGRSLKGQRQAGTGARLATVDGNNQSIQFVTGVTSGVTVKGIKITRFSPNQLWGTAVDFRGPDSGVPAPNSTLIDCEVSFSGQGVATVSGCSVLNNYIHDCDWYGTTGNGSGMLLAGNHFYANRDSSFPGGNSGMMKWVFSTNSRVRNNYIQANNGNGIWLDLGNGRVGGQVGGSVSRNYVHDNLVVGNTYIGIFLEWGFEADVYNNEVYDNGNSDGSHWPGNAGINTTACSGSRIYNNKLDNNAHGIIMRQRADYDGFPGNNGQNDHHQVFSNIVRQPVKGGKGVVFPGPTPFPHNVVIGFDESDGGSQQIPATLGANTYYCDPAVVTWHLGTVRAPGPWGPGQQYDPSGWNALGSALSRTAPDTILTAGAAPPPPPPPPSTITIYPFRLNVGGSEIL